MRRMIGRNAIAVAAVAVLLAAPCGSAAALPAPALGVRIQHLALVGGHVLRVAIATAGVARDAAETPDLTVDAWVGGVRAHGWLLLTYMPAAFAVDIDFPAGAVRVGAVVIGDFPPVRPFTDNARVPVQITVRQAQRVATASRVAALFLPTVIVPGLANELNPRPEDGLAPFVGRGYLSGSGDAPTLFWFAYPSHTLALDAAGRALAAYVRQIVMPQAYAGKINVVGYSLGGLIARWALQFDIDGWAGLVNRLILVGVPNEGSVLAYTYRNVPAFVPYGYFARAPAARALWPTFPFWRASAAEPWVIPPDAGNPALGRLNARPMPQGVRVWVFYGSCRGGAPNTPAGVTERGPGGTGGDAGSGDGVVLAESAQGLPIHGAGGVPALLRPDVVRVDLGPVGHSDLLAAGAGRIAAALLDRFLDTVPVLPAAPPAPLDYSRENGAGR